MCVEVIVCYISVLFWGIYCILHPLLEDRGHITEQLGPQTYIKYSLDFWRPIRTAEVFEAVDWLADLPQRTCMPQAGRSSDVILTSFCWSQQPQSWRRPCLLGIVRRLQLCWLARRLWIGPVRLPVSVLGDWKLGSGKRGSVKNAGVEIAGETSMESRNSRPLTL